MLIIEIRRPHDVNWYGWYTYRLFILDTAEGWFRPLPFLNQTECDVVAKGAEEAAQLFGHTLDWYVIKEG